MSLHTAPSPPRQGLRVPYTRHLSKGETTITCSAEGPGSMAMNINLAAKTKTIRAMQSVVVVMLQFQDVNASLFARLFLLNNVDYLLCRKLVLHE